MGRLAAAWHRPIEELSVLAFSMGGLVARSAIHCAEEGNLPWRRMLRKLVFVGCPHHGAPLERGGNLLDTLLDVSKYSAPLRRLARIRSAGVTDLRFGYVRDEDWMGSDRFAFQKDGRTPLPLPRNVACYAIAGVTAADAAHAGKLAGDGLVPLPSALGKHKKPEMCLEFPEANRWVAYGAAHLDLLGRQDVYEHIRDWLSETRS